MARIRSLHPGQWTDEHFVSCSPFARLLALGLRNEADDNGVFEWKPVQIKMRLLPADNVDIEVLLAELLNCGIVTTEKVHGRDFGYIRNFCQYQRPKAPKSVYPISGKMKGYVGAIPKNSELPRDDSSAIPENAQTDPQMEDGLGVVEEDSPQPPSEASPPGGKAPGDGDQSFSQFWEAFPKKRAGSKQKAWSAWKQARQRASAEEILAGAVRYVESDEVARGYAKGAAAWLNDDRWAVDYTPPRNGSGPGPPLPVTRSGLSPTLERDFYEFQSTNGQARGEDDCDSAVGNPRLPAPTESN